MKASVILSRRSERAVDFRPDKDESSPHAQLRRLKTLLGDNYSPIEDLNDEAIDYYREYLYRKIFTGTSHDEYEGTPADVVDWLIAVHEVESEYFRSQRNTPNKGNSQYYVTANSTTR